MSFLRSLLYGIQREILSDYTPIPPDYVQIETTNRCNLKCGMCAHSSSLCGPRLNTKDMTLGEFKHILSQFSFAGIIPLHGLGEPLLNPELFEMVRYARKMRKYTSFVTNGTLLSEENCKKILESGLNGLGISIDGTTKETYEKIRQGSNFDKVMKNTERMVRLNEKSRAPIAISCHAVIMDENVNEIPGFAEFLQKLGIKELFLSEIVTMPGEECKSKPHPGQTAQIIAKLKEKGKASGLRVTAVEDYAIKKASCFMPWYAVYIKAEGFVTPCCGIPFPDVFGLGNIFKEDFRSIWNNHKYRKLRAMVKSDPPVACKEIECPFFMIWKGAKAQCKPFPARRV